jgi:hypothetical protein
MEWLEGEVIAIGRKREQKLKELETLNNTRAEVLEKSGLENIREQVNRLLKGFEKLSGTEQRNLVDRVVKQIVVRSGNQIDIRFWGEPPPLSMVAERRRVTLRNESVKPDLCRIRIDR